MWFEVDRAAEKSLTEQVYERIRELILTKELKAGERLPSSRELASTIGVSRNVVTEAYHRLISEGYLEVRPRSGTYVTTGSALPATANRNHTPPAPNPHVQEERQKLIDFRAGNPAMDQFPRFIWGRLAKEICYNVPDPFFGYIGPEGAPELRNVLARYLLQARGVRCQPDQIVITSGATQALYLITELLSSAASYIVVEDPVTDEMRTIFTTAGATVRPVPVDDKGILTDRLPTDGNPSFVFVIPSHQFPLGGTLPIQRRIQLIEYARRMSCYIVEDDYDSEFTYEGVPVHSIQGLAPDQVIYVGTFSKILSPALRIGYVVLPQPLVESFRSRKWFMDRHTSSLEQFVLARFIEEGYLNRHVRRMKNIYRQRRETLTDCLKDHFAGAVILGQASGMHLVVELRDTEFTDELVEWIRSQGVAVYPAESYALQKGFHTRQIVMGYGGLTTQTIREGVATLKRAIDSFKKS